MFDKWSGDLTGTVNVNTIMVTQDIAFTAHFESTELTVVYLPLVVRDH